MIQQKGSIMNWFTSKYAQQPIHHSIKNQSKQNSQRIFLKFIFINIFIYAVVTLIAIIFWSVQAPSHNQLSVIDRGKSKNQIKQLEINGEGLSNILSVMTFRDYLKAMQESDNNHHKHSSQRALNPHYQVAIEFMDKFYIFDITIQFSLVFCCLILQYLMFKAKQKKKGIYIEDLTLELSNLPLLPSYIIEPKLQEYLLIQLAKHSQQEYPDAIVDIDTNSTQQKYLTDILTGQLRSTKEVFSDLVIGIDGQQENQSHSSSKRQIEKLQEARQQIKIEKPLTNTAWVTFATRKHRYLAYRMLLQSEHCFLGHRIKVKKAPHPLQIIWRALDYPKSGIIISKIISTAIFVSILLIFDIVILLVYRLENTILGSVSVIVLEALLETIITKANTIQKHKRQSYREISLFQKLTKYFYINTGLIVFLNSYDFGELFIVEIFSTRQFTSLSARWYDQVGNKILLTALIQLVYTNARLLIEYIKRALWNRIFKQNQTKLQAELDICYAQFISTLMVFSTYTFTHPLLYVVCLILCVSSYFSHYRYIKNYSKKPNYNNNQINEKAIQFLLISIVFHFVVVYLLMEKVSALVIAASLTLFVIFKSSIYSKILSICRKNQGPLCLQSYKTQQLNDTLFQMLSCDQVNEKIRWLSLKIQIGNYEYYREYQGLNFVQKGYLDRYIILIKTKMKQLKEQTGKCGGVTKTLQGPINYSVKQTVQARFS